MVAGTGPRWCQMAVLPLPGLVFVIDLAGYIAGLVASLPDWRTFFVLFCFFTFFLLLPWFDPAGQYSLLRKHQDVRRGPACSPQDAVATESDSLPGLLSFFFLFLFLFSILRGFSVSTAGRMHIFKPVSVQAMW